MAKWVKLQEEHNPEEAMNKEAGNKQDGIKALGKVEKLMLFARVDPRVDVSTVGDHTMLRAVPRARARARRRARAKELEEKEEKDEEKELPKEGALTAEELITRATAPRGMARTARAYQRMP